MEAQLRTMGVSQTEEEHVTESVAGKDSGVCKARELDGGLWGVRRGACSNSKLHHNGPAHACCPHLDQFSSGWFKAERKEGEVSMGQETRQADWTLPLMSWPNLVF